MKNIILCFNLVLATSMYAQRQWDPSLAAQAQKNGNLVIDTLTGIQSKGWPLGTLPPDTVTWYKASYEVQSKSYKKGLTAVGFFSTPILGPIHQIHPNFDYYVFGLEDYILYRDSPRSFGNTETLIYTRFDIPDTSVVKYILYKKKVVNGHYIYFYKNLKYIYFHPTPFQTIKDLTILFKKFPHSAVLSYALRPSSWGLWINIQAFKYRKEREFITYIPNIGIVSYWKKNKSAYKNKIYYLHITHIGCQSLRQYLRNPKQPMRVPF